MNSIKNFIAAFTGTIIGIILSLAIVYLVFVYILNPIAEVDIITPKLKEIYNWILIYLLKMF
jgi:hypothetical protein